MAEAFYAPLADGWFRPGANTAGPWDPTSQHFGPPAALLARELENLGDPAKQLARVTVDILGPAPLADMRIDAQVDRPGRSVELRTATLGTAERTVARAHAWCVAHGDTVEQRTSAETPLAPPEQGRAFGRPEGWSPGYLDAMDWVGVRGSLAEPGPAMVWARARVALVEGVEMSPWQRLLVTADSASGVSSWLDPAEWWFINTELTVHAHREPEGDWIGLDAATDIGPTGIGTARAALHDRTGPVGRSTQTLVVRPR